MRTSRIIAILLSLALLPGAAAFAEDEGEEFTNAFPLESCRSAPGCPDVGLVISNDLELIAIYGRQDHDDEDD